MGKRKEKPLTALLRQTGVGEKEEKSDWQITGSEAPQALNIREERNANFESVFTGFVNQQSLKSKSLDSKLGLTMLYNLEQVT